MEERNRNDRKESLTWVKMALWGDPYNEIHSPLLLSSPFVFPTPGIESREDLGGI